MNGNETTYFNEQFNNLKNLVTEIKTENRVKWEEHNKRGKDLQEWLNREFINSKAEDKALAKLLNNLPCGTNTQKINSLEKEYVVIKRLIYTLIFVVVIGTLIKGFL
jgi:hypothetical protein